MSEEILQQLMQLFAIVARVNGEDKGERAVVERFLKERLNLEEIQFYLDLYDTHFRRAGRKNVTVADSSKLLVICTAINEELTQTQKYDILMSLFTLVAVNGTVNKDEREFVSSVADIFNVEYSLYKRIECFCLDCDVDDRDDVLFLIVTSTQRNYTHSKHVFNSHMDGYMAFMQIPGLPMFLVKYYGTNHYYLNGVALEHNRPYTFRMDSNVRGEHFSPVYFSDISSMFSGNAEDYQPIVFEAKDISYRLSDGRHLLYPLSILEEEQRLVAIMGPSGSGKSTLMEILNGIKKPTTGYVAINGVDLHRDQRLAEGIIGYVPQDDLLIEELSVYDNLYYAAKLCYGKADHTELDALVCKTLTSLGLSEIKDFKVGSPMNKVISGGERKRVNIGLELLREPPILFVDEPTSGLSSRDSFNIMGILKDLALQGKIVFTVIHQPSSDIFKLFDKLLILDTGGFPIYYGHPLEAISYFRSMINQINKEKTICSECGNVNNEQLFDIIEDRTVNEQGFYTKNRKITPKQWHNFFQVYCPPVGEKKETKGILRTRQEIASAVKQYFIFMHRDLKSKYANRQYMLINLLQAPFLALLLSVLHRYSPTEVYSFEENENLPIYLFIAIITSLFMGLVLSAEELFKDRKISKRERFLHLNRVSYLLSKISVMFLFSAVQTLVFTYLGNLVMGIEGIFWQMWLILFSSAACANLIGLNLSASFNSAVTIYIFIPLVLIPQLVLGGVVIEYDKLNTSLRFSQRSTPLFADIMTSRWAFEGLMVVQFLENRYFGNRYETEQRAAVAEYKKLYVHPKLDVYFKNLLATSKELDSTNEGKELKKTERLFYYNLKKEIQLNGLGNRVSLLDSAVNENTKEHYVNLLEQLKQSYNAQLGLFHDQRLNVDEQLAKKLGSFEAVSKLKRDNFNRSVARFVKNVDAEPHLIEDGEQLLPMVYPIYMRPSPKYLLDYRARMYSGEKHFLGSYFPTFTYNVAVIWILTLVLAILLYFNLPSKFVAWCGKWSLEKK